MGSEAGTEAVDHTKTEAGTESETDEEADERQSPSLHEITGKSRKLSDTDQPRVSEQRIEDADSWCCSAAVKSEKSSNEMENDTVVTRQPAKMTNKESAARRDDRRPAELSLPAAIGGHGELVSRQDYSPYSPHHPLRDYYYQSLFSRLYSTYPLPHPAAFAPSSPLFPPPCAGTASFAALRFSASSPSAMSPSPSPASPLSSPSPYNVHFQAGAHFDFSKNHIF